MKGHVLVLNGAQMGRTNKDTDHIDTVYRQVKDLYDTDHLPAELYNKSLLALAYEYMLEGDINSTIQMVSECPKAYICKTMSEHMDDDDKFKLCVIKLVKMIDESSINLNDIVDDEEAFWLNKAADKGKFN